MAGDGVSLFDRETKRPVPGVVSIRFHARRRVRSCTDRMAGTTGAATASEDERIHCRRLTDPLALTQVGGKKGVRPASRCLRFHRQDAAGSLYVRGTPDGFLVLISDSLNSRGKR